jgi:putative heme uptake system protein
MKTYLLIDGENIDFAIAEIIHRQPTREDRPKWENVLSFADTVWPNDGLTAMFFINVSNREPPYAFCQALTSMGYRPVLLSGGRDRKVVDEGIQKVMKYVIKDTDGNIILVSHDKDFLPDLKEAIEAKRRVGALCFPEMMAECMRALDGNGLEVFDFERHAKAFAYRLNRLMIMDIDQFDPKEFI